MFDTSDQPLGTHSAKWDLSWRRTLVRMRHIASVADGGVCDLPEVSRADRGRLRGGDFRPHGGSMTSARLRLAGRSVATGGRSIRGCSLLPAYRPMRKPAPVRSSAKVSGSSPRGDTIRRTGRSSEVIERAGCELRRCPLSDDTPQIPEALFARACGADLLPGAARTTNGTRLERR